MVMYAKTKKRTEENTVNIEEWMSYKKQDATLGNERWSIVRLISLSENLQVMDVPLVHLNIDYSYTNVSLKKMVMHFNAVKNANLDFPIILDEDGIVLDGRHRIMKALMLGEETIKAVRFEVNPEPCSIDG